MLGTDSMALSDDYTHLGLNWASNHGAPDVESKIALARGTAYALLGVGLHGDSGLDPGASVKLISTYATLRLLYGLDSINLAKKDIAVLDAFYKQLLKRMQGLPDNTANEAVYLLLGMVPVEGIIHIKVPTLFGAISRLEGQHPLR